MWDDAAWGGGVENIGAVEGDGAVVKRGGVQIERDLYLSLTTHQVQQRAGLGAAVTTGGRSPAHP